MASTTYRRQNLRPDWEVVVGAPVGSDLLGRWAMDRDRLRYRFGVVLSFAFWVLVALYTVAVFAALVIVFTALAGDHP